MSIVIVEPASSGVELVRAAHELHWPVAVLTGRHGDVSACEACQEMGATIYRVDTRDVAQLIPAMATLPAVDAILPGMEYYVETAARLADILSLPNIGPIIARRFRNKYEMRLRLAEQNIEIPAFAILPHEPTAAITAARDVGFPAVLKPIDGAGSMGVIRVDNERMLATALQAIPSHDFLDLGYQVGKEWMIESYIPGPEFSLEGVVTDIGAQIVAVTQKMLGPEPYFVEMGHVVEADISQADQFILMTYTKKAIAALGLPLGVFHAEVRLSPAGPRLIEVAARLGGDRIPLLVELACGVSLAKLALYAHRYGRVSAEDICDNRSSRRCAGVRFLTTADVGLDARRAQIALQNLSNVEEVKLDISRAHSLHTPICDFRDRIGHVVCAADRYETLLTLLGEAVNAFSITDSPTYYRDNLQRRPLSCVFSF
jgi:biotin carboxylase